MMEVSEDQSLKCPHCHELISEDQVVVVEVYKCKECGQIYELKSEAKNCCVEIDEDEENDDEEVI